VPTLTWINISTDILVCIAIRLGDEALYLRFAKTYESLARTPHSSWSDYCAEMEDAQSLTFLSMALTGQCMAELRE